MKTIYLEPAWKHNLSANDLTSYPPEGYRFLLDSGKERGLFQIASKTNLTYSIQSILGRKIPLMLVKSYLEKLRRVPQNTDLTLASIHMVLRKEPWILDMQCEPPHLLLGNGWGEKQLFSYRETGRRILTTPHCRKIICWVEAGKRALLSWLGDDLEEKVKTIYWGVPHRNFAKNYSKEKIKLLFVNSGNINTADHFNVKGGAEVFETFLELNKRYDNLQLVIRSGLPDSIYRKYNSNSNIKILNKPVSWEELENEWKSADIFIFPSRVTPAKVFIDAMSYELPIVTTDIWGNPEMVEDGKTGLLVHYAQASNYIHNWIPYTHAGYRESFKAVNHDLVNGMVNQISKLIENTELRQTMGKAGRWEVEHGKFAIKSRNDKLKRIFDEATS